MQIVSVSLIIVRSFLSIEDSEIADRNRNPENDGIVASHATAVAISLIRCAFHHLRPSGLPDHMSCDHDYMSRFTDYVKMT
jgi:hypothetical protein